MNNVTIVAPNITEEERQRRIKQIQRTIWGIWANLSPSEKIRIAEKHRESERDVCNRISEKSEIIETAVNCG